MLYGISMIGYGLCGLEVSFVCGTIRIRECGDCSIGGEGAVRLVLGLRGSLGTGRGLVFRGRMVNGCRVSCKNRMFGSGDNSMVFRRIVISSDPISIYVVV